MIEVEMKEKVTQLVQEEIKTKSNLNIGEGEKSRNGLNKSRRSKE